MKRLLLVLFLASPLLALGQPIVIGEQFTIESAILGETRTIQVHDPGASQAAGLVTAPVSYPVIYLLDGPGHFHHTTGTVSFLAQQGKMPSAIVVAIGNTDRTRDLTPPTSVDPDGNFPTAGGASEFLRFIADELAPYVESRYNTEPYRLLIGHSFGGLFAVHALLTRPDFFDAYLAISPSLWWDDQEQVNQAEQFLADAEDLRGDLYMTMGNEGGPMLGGGMKLAGLLEESAGESFRWHFEHMGEETHGSVPGRSTYDGLEHIFNEYWLPNPFALVQDGNLDALDAHYEAISERFGYAMHTPELTVNQIGYGLMGNDQMDEAIAIFERNVARFPESSNVYDSLGEAYMTAGRNEEAVTNYRKSLELNPANTNAVTMLERLGASSQQ